VTGTTFGAISDLESKGSTGNDDLEEPLGVERPGCPATLRTSSTIWHSGGTVLPL
jgi:hypothetical protein